MDVGLVKRQIEQLSETASIAHVADTVDKLATLSAMARELKATLDARLIAYIQHNGPITVGVNRYYVAPKRTTKARSNLAVMRAVLDATQGDVDRIAVELLAADAFKPGACAKLLTPAAFGEAFEITTTPDLKTGKPRPELHKVDERFVDRSRHGTPELETP